MNENFVKFPSTPHLATLPGVEIRDDKVLTAQERREFLTRELTVEEKLTERIWEFHLIRVATC